MADENGNDGSKKKGGVLGDLVRAESMVQVALALPVGCLIGVVGGGALDKHFHTHWIAITGLLLGVAGGFIQMYRTASSSMKGPK